MGAEVLILGMDGASWDILDPWAARFPNLRALWTGGVRASLQSTNPPMTLPAWSSVLTGVNPGEHGILDFTHRPRGTYRVEFLSARDRLHPTLHEILSHRGRRAASIAVPGTWPPSPLDGVVVSGFDSPVATSVSPAHCAPRGVYEGVLRRFGGLRFADFAEAGIGPGWHARAYAALMREAGRKEAVCAHLLAAEPWSAFMVVFGESDTAAHHFWMFHDERSPRHRPEHQRALLDIYERLDAAVGRLAQHCGTVCVVSDHGFGGAGVLALYLNRFLEQHGWLRMKPGGVLADRARGLALSLPVGSALRRIPAHWLGDAETRARYGGIDFTRTRAWSDETSYAASIHLNVRGRDPLGTVTDVEGATRDIERLLLDWRIDGAPVVAHVRRRSEVMSGPASATAPDLILELALHGGYSATPLPSSRVAPGVTWRRLSPAEFVGGKGLGMNGSHRPEGVLILHGPAFRAGVSTTARVEDILPTLLHALGEPVPGHVEGRVLVEAFCAGAPPRSAAAGPTAPSGLLLPRRPGQAAHARERLRALGYL